MKADLVEGTEEAEIAELEHEGDLTTAAPPSGGRVVRDGVIYVGGTVIQGGLGFLLLPFATRIMGVNEFGVVGVALAVSSVLTALYPLGINFAIVRLYYDEPSTARRTHWAMLLRVQIVMACVLAVVTFMSGPFWTSAFKGMSWGAALQLSILYSFALSVQNTAQGVLRAARRPIAYVATSLVETGVGATLALGLAVHYGAAGYMFGLAAGSAAAAVIAIKLSYKKPRWDRRVVRAGLLLGLPFLFHNLSGWVLNLSDRILVERYRGVTELGRYFFAYTIASVVYLLLDGAQSAWAPAFYSMKSRAKYRLTEVLLVPTTAIAGSMAALLVLASPIVVSVAAPKEFGKEYLVIALVAATAVVRPMYLFGAPTLLDVKSSKAIAVASVSAGIFNFGVNLVLVPIYGINAAAATTLAAYGLQAVIVHLKAAKLTGNSPHLANRLLLWGVWIALICALSFLPTTTAGWVIRLVCGAMTLLVALYYVRVLSARYKATALYAASMMT